MSFRCEPRPDKLLITPQPYDDESLAGYIIRLSEANYYESPNWILQLAGCKNNQQKKGVIFLEDNHEPTKLSWLTNISDELLKSKAFEANHRKNYVYYGLIQKATTLCPECLKESSYARFIWDYETNKVCPIHRCHLIDKCPQCNQAIQWSRASLVRCSCGFDFREALTKNAPEDLVNFSLYRYGQSGNLQCMKSIQVIYGADNPVFSVTFPQFQKISQFLVGLIADYLVNQTNSQLSQEILTKSHINSPLISSEELVFAFFKNLPTNINSLFQWREHRSLQRDFRGQTISSMVYDIAQFTSLFPINSPLAKNLESALLNYLEHHKVTQIEVNHRLPQSNHRKIFSLENLDEWLPTLDIRLNDSGINLSRLIFSYRRIKSVRVPEKNSTWKVVLSEFKKY